MIDWEMITSVGITNISLGVFNVILGLRLVYGLIWQDWDRYL